MSIPADPFNSSHFEKVRLPPTEADTLPYWAYTSQAWYDREVERIFRKGWTYVGHSSQLPKQGDYLTRELAGMPVIVVRGKDDEIRAFYNSCRHRGSRILWGDGNCNAMRCPYHSWTYSLDGRLAAIPIVDDTHLVKDELPLHQIRLEEADGFIFLTFNPEAESLSSYLGSLPQELAAYRPSDLVCTRRVVHQVKANWKLFFENFNDSLHVPFIHKGSLARQKVSGRQRSSHVETDANYIAHFTQHQGSRGLLEDDQGHGFSRLEGLEGRYLEGTYYPCILPATLLSFTIDSAWVYELNPKGPALTEVAITSFFPRKAVERDDFEAVAQRYYRRADVIMPEDNVAVEQQQEGLSVPAGMLGKFTSLETLCHAFDNWILDQVVEA